MAPPALDDVFMHASSDSVTACIPYYQCKSHIRTAVMSLLSQTHRDLTVVVINDGDSDPPWGALADIHDPRLIRFNLQINRGTYFALETCLRATCTPYFLVQDADDWSDPRRVELLIRRLKAHGADYATSTQPQYRLEPHGKLSFAFLKWPSPPDPLLKPLFSHRICHHGLFRTQSLRAVGGYYGGFRVGYDMLVMNFMMMTGRVSHIPKPLYHRVIRQMSLSHCDSKSRQAQYVITQIIPHMYSRAYGFYREHQCGRISSERFLAEIHSIAATYVTAADHAALREATDRLSACFLSSPGCRNLARLGGSS